MRWFGKVIFQLIALVTSVLVWRFVAPEPVAFEGTAVVVRSSFRGTVGVYVSRRESEAGIGNHPHG